jgi:ribonuclease T2
MTRRRIGIGAAFALALSCCPTMSGAQSSWDDVFRGPSAPRPAPTSCVLDKCLNGAAQSPPRPAPGAQPSPPPASAGTVAPGDFDFYLLTLSWSPGFCDSGGAAKSPDQCRVGSKLGFVVHGLWPQFQHGYPSDCDPSRPVSRAALQETAGVFPSEGLARYEWRKHGTCTGLSPEAFFASVKRARDSIVIPDGFESPRERQTVSPLAILRAFAAVNPGLKPETMAVGCKRGELEDVRLCLSKDLRQFVSCPEVARSTCRSQAIAVAPVL